MVGLKIIPKYTFKAGASRSTVRRFHVFTPLISTSTPRSSPISSEPSTKHLTYNIFRFATPILRPPSFHTFRRRQCRARISNAPCSQLPNIESIRQLSRTAARCKDIYLRLNTAVIQTMCPHVYVLYAYILLLVVLCSTILDRYDSHIGVSRLTHSYTPRVSIRCDFPSFAIRWKLKTRLHHFTTAPSVHSPMLQQLNFPCITPLPSHLPI